MVLYKLFSCNVEVQYKSCLLSKATLFTFTTAILNIILPFIIAYRSRGFWLKSHIYYEQPLVHFKYDYLIVAETEDPSQPIVCGEALILGDNLIGEENCAEIQVQEYDHNRDSKNDMIHLKIHLNIPLDRTIVSLITILALDFQLTTVCPLQMQSLAIINKDFSIAASGMTYFGDLKFYQVAHLPCVRNILDIKYNSSLLSQKKDTNENIIDFILERYWGREVTTQIETINSRTRGGHTSFMDVDFYLRIPEMEIRYVPSLLQELKWAWPQYLSLVVVFYWIFNKIKKFVFNNRLLMAWEIVPWKRSQT